MNIEYEYLFNKTAGHNEHAHTVKRALATILTKKNICFGNW